jgi:hypothetical protein
VVAAPLALSSQLTVRLHEVTSAVREGLGFAAEALATLQSGAYQRRKLTELKAAVESRLSSDFPA